MWGYLSLLPAFLAIWAVAGIWTVFALAVANKSVNLNEGFPYISICGSYPPQSCLFSQVLNMGAALAAWICILRYHQLQDWGVTRRFNQLILWTGLLSALGTSMVGNFQQKNQKPTHLTGAFLAFFVGILYFWLQLLLFWRKKNLPQPGSPWIGPLRLGLCTICTILMKKRHRHTGRRICEDGGRDWSDASASQRLPTIPEAKRENMEQILPTTLRGNMALLTP
ncbi:modulator of macroautophagy TMEM150B isoform X4 [Elephas maximus indicus]|uniref:modulator of macroautophagy TMEM150B isoform X4 n=1 Tax=Elephas maximus indicus TaxID=99487 RepID=UPI002116340E|nr:modulator of macroautophagy TMEM150B isoform X4 [Elephas maximus indicus]